MGKEARIDFEEEEVEPGQRAGKETAVPALSVEVEVLGMAVFEPADGADAFGVKLAGMGIIFLAGDGDAAFGLFGAIDLEWGGDAHGVPELEELPAVNPLRVPGEDLVEGAQVPAPVFIRAVGGVFEEEQVELLSFHAPQFAEIRVQQGWMIEKDGGVEFLQVIHVERGDAVAQLAETLRGEIEAVHDVVADWPGRVIEHPVAVIVFVKAVKAQIHWREKLVQTRRQGTVKSGGWGDGVME